MEGESRSIDKMVAERNAEFARNYKKADVLSTF